MFTTKSVSNVQHIPTMEFGGKFSANLTTRNGDTFNTTDTKGFPTPEGLAFKAFKLFCYSLVFLLGVTGNVLVFRMVIKRRKLRTVGNIFICNLAAADIAVLTINLPFRLAYQENSYIWPFGAFLCKIIPMLTYLFIAASSATLVLMTIDQYRAIATPLGRRFTIKITKMVIFSIWAFSALITLPFNFALKLVKHERGPVCTDVWSSEEYERFYFLCLFVVQFVIPMTITISCYILICNHLHSSSGLDHITSTKQRNKKVIKMFVVIAAVYAVFTLPYYVTWLFSVFGYPNSVAKKLCVLLVMATSAAHPIIYGTLNQEFAKGFKAFFRCTKETRRYKDAREKRLNRCKDHPTKGRTQAEKAKRVSCQVTRKETHRKQYCRFQRENEKHHVEIVSSL